MLVCPQCDLENPNNAKNCQKCGTSLTHKPCPQCQEKVPLNIENCNECGALVGQVWQAIIMQSKVPKTENPSNGGIHELKETKIKSQLKPLIFDSGYLDVGQRYQLLGTNKATSLEVIKTSNWLYYQAEVIDCQPLQRSVLAVLLEHSSELLADETDITSTASWQSMGIPDVVLSYLGLKDLSPMIPSVHDAWREEDTQIILLSNRSEWQKLSDLVLNEALVTLQNIYWLDQIADLWERLSTVNCCQSLLIDHNLRVDEDQSISLQQLYQDSHKQAPSLRDLGQFWQRWFMKGKYQPSQELETLIEQVANGQLDSVTEFQLQLKKLATQQQTASEETPQGTSEKSSEISTEIPTDLWSEFEKSQTELLDEISEDFLLNSEILENTDELSTDVLPMELLSLNDCGLTDRGQQRLHNEDYFEIVSDIHTNRNNQGTNINGHGLYIVCDGMGGHAAGEVASKMAVETLHNFFDQQWQDQFPDHQTLLQGILKTNQRLYQVNQNNASSGSGRMGTTLVLALIENTKMAIAHVGDSRMYRLTRQQGLEQLTIDHEVGQKAIQNGVDPDIAYGRPDAYQLTQALGPHDNNFIQPDIRFLDVQEDTLFLLCSDGLSDNDLIETYWQTYLAPLLSSRNSLEQGLNKLIDFANQYNGHDNITAVLVRVKVQPKMSLDD